MKIGTAFAALAASVGLFLAMPAAAHGDAHADGQKAPPKEQTAWGIAGEAKAVRRTIHLAMSDDMRFTPDRIEVRQGETLRLTVANRGAILHELVIGTRDVLDQHAELMRKYPNMEHAEPYMVHVPPGKRGEIVWTFNRAGEFDFACLIAGHYQAGMVGRIVVRKAGAGRS